jgi:ABC-2 type transport system ATP-binding protein
LNDDGGRGQVLDVKDLNHAYGKSERGIFGLNFSLSKGERVALLGLNGAGKSTTFRAIAGLIPLEKTKVFIGGLDLASKRKEALGKVGYLSENSPLPLELTPRQYLVAECQLRGVSYERYTPSLVAEFELDSVLERPMFSLSRGFRKRIGLAASMCHGPSLLLLDEPTAGLDPHQVEQFRNLIKGVSRRCAVLISTHVLAEVEALCQRCLILHLGRLRSELTLPVEGDGRYFVEAQFSGGRPEGAFSVEGEDRFCYQTPPLVEPSQWLAERVKLGWRVWRFEPVQRSLEQDFLRIIGGKES